MEEVTQTDVIPYRDEVLIELIGVDTHGDIEVMTYQFDYAGDESTRICAKQSIDPEYQPIIEDTLEANGYELA